LPNEPLPNPAPRWLAKLETVEIVYAFVSIHAFGRNLPSKLP